MITTELVKRVLLIENMTDWKRVNKAMRMRYNQLSEQMLLDFRNGDKVEFDHKGRTIKGIVSGMTANNKKTIPIKVSETERWKVSVNLVRHSK